MCSRPEKSSWLENISGSASVLISSFLRNGRLLPLAYISVHSRIRFGTADVNMSGQVETKEEHPSTFNHVEDGPRSDTGQDADERALLRKIDMRLVPCVWIMYLMSYVSLFGA